MVDEYSFNIEPLPAPFLVQIPLWSMNTLAIGQPERSLIRSDSSMVDEYTAWATSADTTKSSDSSMVDEYKLVA